MDWLTLCIIGLEWASILSRCRFLWLNHWLVVSVYKSSLRKFPFSSYSMKFDIKKITGGKSTLLPSKHKANDSCE